MSTSKEFRKRAWSRVTGDLGGYLIPFLLVMVGTSVVSCMISFVTIIGASNGEGSALSGIGVLLSLIVSLVTMLLMYGLVHLYQRKRETVTSLEDLLYPFRHLPGLNILTLLRVFIQTYLWSLLFIVPGIIKGFSYSMTSFLLMDEDVEFEGTGDVIRTSMAMMNGNKFRLFKLAFTFIGWFLLSIPTFGLAMFFVIPYFYAALIEFYVEVRDAYFGNQG